MEKHERDGSMEYDITRLTFLPDPLTYQAQTDEICVRVPVGVSSTEDLLTILREGLGFPNYQAISWSNTLEEVLRSWDDWSTRPRRVTIIHSDLPFVRSSKDGWFNLQIYLQVLIQSIIFLQEKDADATERRELVAIFPARMAEELQTILNHPSAWTVTLGFRDVDIKSAFDPDWSIISQDLRELNGVTAEVCTLAREDAGYMMVYYQKDAQAYSVEYRSQDNEVWLVASAEEQFALPPVLSFDLASHIVETFFTSSQRSSSVYWHAIPLEDQFELEVMRERSSYRNAEEALLELYVGMARVTIEEGVYEAIERGDEGFSVAYWKDVLERHNASPSQRLTALCVVGLSDLPEASALLRPFLRSSVKRERWASARFLGVSMDEEALPILLQMLTDELPLKKNEENAGYDPWYDNWRLYAPRLLRKWQRPEIDERLRQALAVWVQAESQFDPEFDTWLKCEKEICYELGCRGDFSALRDVSLEDERKRELQAQIERGYKVKQLQMTAEEEYNYLRYGKVPKR
jgi:hypothetical protein